MTAQLHCGHVGLFVRWCGVLPLRPVRVFELRCRDPNGGTADLARPGLEVAGRAQARADWVGLWCPGHYRDGRLEGGSERTAPVEGDSRDFPPVRLGIGRPIAPGTLTRPGRALPRVYRGRRRPRLPRLSATRTVSSGSEPLPAHRRRLRRTTTLAIGRWQSAQSECDVALEGPLDTTPPTEFEGASTRRPLGV